MPIEQARIDRLSLLMMLTKLNVVEDGIRHSPIVFLVVDVVDKKERNLLDEVAATELLAGDVDCAVFTVSQKD